MGWVGVVFGGDVLLLRRSCGGCLLVQCGGCGAQLLLPGRVLDAVLVFVRRSAAHHPDAHSSCCPACSCRDWKAAFEAVIPSRKRKQEEGEGDEQQEGAGSDQSQEQPQQPQQQEQQQEQQEAEQPAAKRQATAEQS